MKPASNLSPRATDPSNSNWPSKSPGQPSGPGRGNNPPKRAN